MIDSAALRHRMAVDLQEAGEIRSPAWRRAVEDVPRELFVSDRFLQAIDSQGPRWQEVTPAAIGLDAWLERIYSNDTLVTQVAGDNTALVGPPTSSSTMPGLVVRMLEDLDVTEGMTVLEIGTGTGYSTALLCQRLGDDLVTSVEVDSELAARARAALETAGYKPTVVTGDGLQGWPAGSPYDRLIATCAVRTVPPSWLSQVRPGGYILTSLCGALGAYAYARLRVTDSGAEGVFLPGTVSFMFARAHVPEPWSQLPFREGITRSTNVGPSILADWTGRFVAQTAVWNARYTSYYANGSAGLVHLVGDACGSYAWLTETERGWQVTESGPRRLWAEVEAALGLWERHGRPTQDQYSIAITLDGRLTISPPP